MSFQIASAEENEYGIVKAWFNGENATVETINDIKLKCLTLFASGLKNIPSIVETPIMNNVNPHIDPYIPYEIRDNKAIIVLII